MLAQKPERAHPDFDQFRPLPYISLPARVDHLDHLRNPFAAHRSWPISPFDPDSAFVLSSVTMHADRRSPSLVFRCIGNMRWAINTGRGK